MRGTTGYRAPELLPFGSATYNNKVDIWALGCILFEIVTRTKRFESDEEARWLAKTANITFEINFRADIETDNYLSGLIYAALELDPVRRPSAVEIIKEIGWRMGTGLGQVFKMLGLFVRPIQSTRRSEALFEPSYFVSRMLT